MLHLIKYASATGKFLYVAFNRAFCLINSRSVVWLYALNPYPKQKYDAIWLI